MLAVDNSAVVKSQIPETENYKNFYEIVINIVWIKTIFCLFCSVWEPRLYAFCYLFLNQFISILMCVYNFTSVYFNFSITTESNVISEMNDGAGDCAYVRLYLRYKAE